MNTVYQLIAANQAKLAISSMSKVLRVSRSGYYDWKDRKPGATWMANIQLMQKIAQIHQASDGAYGMPRIKAELNEQGIVASGKRIARLMR